MAETETELDRQIYRYHRQADRQIDRFEYGAEVIALFIVI